MMRQKGQNSKSSKTFSNFSEFQKHIDNLNAKELEIHYFSFGQEMELLYCSPIKLSNSQIRDTTGAGKNKNYQKSKTNKMNKTKQTNKQTKGDVFFGAISYAVAYGFSDEQTLRLGNFVSSEKIKNFSIHGIPREIPSFVLLN